MTVVRAIVQRNAFNQQVRLFLLLWIIYVIQQDKFLD
jgi:hypothetical protein